jgi:hypothetical protein
MDELVRSKKLQFEKSNLFIQIYKQESGIEYIKIIHIKNLMTKVTKFFIDEFIQ